MSQVPMFAQQIEQWHDFYLMIGGAAAVLLGLLFLGASLNIELIRRTTYIDVRELAAQSFNSLFYVLVYAIILLVPQQTPLGTGLPVLVISLPGLVGTVAHLAKARQQRRTWGTLPLSRRFVPPIFALALATLVAVSLLVGETAGLYVLVLAIVILVISAVQDAWGLLVLIGGEERDGTTS